MKGQNAVTLMINSIQIHNSLIKIGKSWGKMVNKAYIFHQEWSYSPVLEIEI